LISDVTLASIVLYFWIVCHYTFPYIYQEGRLLTGHIVDIALCLSQLSHLPEEMRRMKTSRGEAYCEIIQVMKAHQTKGLFFCYINET